MDRDGTVIVDPLDERVDREDKIQLFNDSIESLKYLDDHNFAVIFITNQAGIAEGKITIEDFERINTKVQELLSPSGVKILKTVICPHIDKDKCDCRKPKPKMILEAAEEFGIVLANSYMVGDHVSDIEAGINAGTKTVLVQTATNEKVTAEQATFTAHDLLSAVKYIVSNS